MAIVFLCSCARSEGHIHPEGISVANLNQAVQVIAPQAWNTFKLTEPVSLQVANMSDKTISFDKDFGSRIFRLDNKQWVEMKNTMTSLILGGGEEILMKTATNNKYETRGYSIKLDFSEKTSKAEIRIYIFGKIVNTEEAVGAYIDVVLKP